ncbi:acyl--CoA ligase [Nonomuraea sp. NBC_01738]|uniref:class I adenylate-forming enzyme family protein n=1 Tax=Nonomuraea sp. NBC_01738 TaxID=2976003 RepID=UPI002E156C99|nr:acyl--CoA ligase [Nonomuraea sp. NBC_01738]
MTHSADRIARYTALGPWTGETIGQLLMAHVEARPDATAIIDPPNKAGLLDGPVKRLTWAGLHQEVERVAGALHAAGVGPGGVVAVQLPNSVELAVTYLAVLRLGAAVTPFPVQYREYELAQLLPLSGASLLVTGRESRAPEGTRVLAWPGDLEKTEAGAAPAYRADPADLVTICWTSGTETTPKGVPRCHYDWLAVEALCTAAPALTSDDVILNPFPMVNMAGIGGVFLPWLRSGATLVQHHPFDLPVYLGQISAENVTYTLAPPALLTMLLLKEVPVPPSLTRIGSGSAPLPPSMVRGWQERHGIAIINFFGSNEGITLLSDPEHMPDPEVRARYFPRPGAPGAPALLDHVEVRLVSPEGEEITEPGVPGELRLNGPTVFAGYLPGTAAAEPFDERGDLRTGDLFEIAGAQGQYLRYVDRAKDIIIRGGMNIAPAELEALLSGHPAIAEVAVAGFADEVLGEKVCAVVVPRGELDLESVVAFLRGKGIASYKLPERLELVEALPRNPVGKILKRELKL